MLIIKLLGQSIGYKTLFKRITSLWKLKATIYLVETDNRFFLVKFAAIEDYDFAKYNKSLMIFNHYLTDRSWKPNFDPDQNNLKNLLVWVRIPCLPIEYYDMNFLMKVGEMISKPVKIDEAISLLKRPGHFAYMCVEIDLEKSLISMFRLRSNVRKIYYKCIHLVCLSCGRFNHWKDECPLEQKTAPQELEGSRIGDIEDDNPSNDQGKV